MSKIDNGNGVRTKIVSSRLQVWVPYNPKFVEFARSMEARWRKRTWCWSFKRLQFAQVAQKLNELYGTSIKFHAVDTDV